MAANKPIHAKPSLYAYYFHRLKEVALKYGYNLVLHGSLNRDLDLIAIPWQEEIGSADEMAKEIASVIGGYLLYGNGVDSRVADATEYSGPKDWYSVTHHGRMQYVININRDAYMVETPEGKQRIDPMYYIDLSVIPTLK